MISQADIAAAFDRAKARCVDTVLQGGIHDPIALTLCYFDEELTKLQKSAPAAVTTEAASNLGVGPVINLTVHHLEINVKN